MAQHTYEPVANPALGCRLIDLTADMNTLNLQDSNTLRRKRGPYRCYDVNRSAYDGYPQAEYYQQGHPDPSYQLPATSQRPYCDLPEPVPAATYPPTAISHAQPVLPQEYQNAQRGNAWPPPPCHYAQELDAFPTPERTPPPAYQPFALTTAKPFSPLPHKRMIYYDPVAGSDPWVAELPGVSHPSRLQPRHQVPPFTAPRTRYQNAPDTTPRDKKERRKKEKKEETKPTKSVHWADDLAQPRHHKDHHRSKTTKKGSRASEPRKSRACATSYLLHPVHLCWVDELDLQAAPPSPHRSSSSSPPPTPPRRLNCIPWLVRSRSRHHRGHHKKRTHSRGHGREAETAEVCRRLSYVLDYPREMEIVQRGNGEFAFRRPKRKV